ncbi:MAG TPA: hypothetical protein VI819_00185 [Patescibacteria group bacterium]|nr:hypothetical protein [Patescibacteria group bacterium]
MLKEIIRRLTLKHNNTPATGYQIDAQTSLDATAINVTTNDLMEASNAQGLEKLHEILEGNLGKSLPPIKNCLSGSAYRIITNNNRFQRTEFYLSDLCFTSKSDEPVRISDIGILIPTKKDGLRRLTFTRDPDDYSLIGREAGVELFRLPGKTRDLPKEMSDLSNGRLKILEDLDQLGVKTAIAEYLIQPFKSALKVHNKDAKAFLRNIDI